MLQVQMLRSWAAAATHQTTCSVGDSEGSVPHSLAQAQISFDT